MSDRKRIKEAVLARLEAAEDHPFTRQLYAEVGEECGVKWHEVQLAVDSLQRAGWVRKYKRPGEGNHYRLKPTPVNNPHTLTAHHTTRGAQPSAELAEGLDLKKVGDKELRSKLYADLKKKTTGEAGALTLINGHLVQRAWEEPDWDGARAWIDERDEVANGGLAGLWREFGVPTEWTRAELKRQGFTARKKGWQVQRYVRDSNPVGHIAHEQLRKAVRVLKEAGYNCAQAQDLIEEVWD